MLLKKVFKTKMGFLLQGKAEEILPLLSERFKGKIDLIFTSPPFPLNRKKKYGNLQGEEYIRWLSGFAPVFRSMLKPKGSVVLELGNSWESGKPVMSTLALEALLEFKRQGKFHLCERCIYFNTARLPSPVQWVNIKRIRIKDAFTELWWMSKSENPKADNRKILTEYKDSMKQLQKRRRYNSGRRPSEHKIGRESFFMNNDGAIPPNVITLSNTHSNTPYLNFCKENNLVPHPARMPRQLAEFFIKFLTNDDDLVFDPFAGSNTTGEAAELLNRKWMGIEPNDNYIKGSIGRFKNSQKIINKQIQPAQLNLSLVVPFSDD